MSNTFFSTLSRRMRCALAALASFTIAVILTVGLVSTTAFADESSRLTAETDVAGISEAEVLSTTFRDVTDTTSWYYNSVYAAANLGVIEGYPNGTFGPAETLTRAQAATILWRYYCPDAAANYDSSDTSNTTGMSDVKENTWYTAAANWAVNYGVISGKETSSGKRYFDPNGVITREQLCTIIANTVTHLNGTKTSNASWTKMNTMPDVNNVSSWAKNSVAWCLNSGIISGRQDSSTSSSSTRYIDPNGAVDRATMAAVVTNAVNNSKLGSRTCSAFYNDYFIVKAPAAWGSESNHLLWTIREQSTSIKNCVAEYQFQYASHHYTVNGWYWREYSITEIYVMKAGSSTQPVSGSTRIGTTSNGNYVWKKVYDTDFFSSPSNGTITLR